MRVQRKWVGKILQLEEVSESDSYLPNIYEDFLPLALMAKISLVLPIRDIFEGMKRMNFNWYSFEVIAVLLLNPCLGYVLASQIPYDDGSKSNLIVGAAGFLISNMWFVFGQKTLINLLEKIDQFDNSLTFHSKVSYQKKVTKYIWVFAVCIYPLALAARIILANYNLEPCLKYKCALMEIIKGFFRYQHHLQMAIYMFLCYEIKSRFKTMNIIFYDFIKKAYQSDTDLDENYSQLEIHRLQYARLIQCTKTLNLLFSWRFAFILAVMILHIIWLLYEFYTEEGYVITGYDVLVIFFNFFLLFFVAHNTDLLVTESQNMESYLGEISTQDLNWASMFQLDHTIHQSEMFQVNITACEMVTIEKSLMLSMAGAISMYYIAILQMTTTNGSFSW